MRQNEIIQYRFKPCDSGEVLVTYPSGRCEFLGPFRALWLAWKVLRAGHEVEVD